MILCAWAVESVSAEGPIREPGDLATRFAAAWNAHDSAAFAALMATDADWVTASGVRLRGRAQIQAFLAEEHELWAHRTTMRALNIRVRSLDRKTAVVLFEWEIATPRGPGEAPLVSRGNNLFVASDDKGWIIVAGQVARAPSR